MIAIFDKQRIESGGRIPLGWHAFTLRHPKAEPYSTNLFVWYGLHNLGNLGLKRSHGRLNVSASPPVPVLTIQGPEFSLLLTNSSGITTNLPTDRYTVVASYGHWQQTQEVDVASVVQGKCSFTPRIGHVELSCNQPDASFQLFKADGQLLEAGELPAHVLDVPQGDYKLIGWHHKHKNERSITISAGITNNAEIEFVYGTAHLESDPPGAAVFIGSSEFGVTPLVVSELTPGRQKFQVRLNGYLPADVIVDVVAQQTNILRTNLVSLSYARAMDAARKDLIAGEYDRAFSEAGSALEVKKDDPEASAIQREAQGRRHIRQAELFGKRGDYIAADRELEAALQSVPDCEEAKQLFSDFKPQETEQLERLREERLARGKNLFNAALARIPDASLFESQEFKTSKPVREVETAILEALKIQPSFHVTKSKSPTLDTFEIVAEQELLTALATRAGRRICVIVGAQAQNEETDIFYKVLEYKAEAVNKLSIGAVIGAPTEVRYLPIHESRVGNITAKLKAQMEEGAKMVIDRIQTATGHQAQQK